MTELIAKIKTRPEKVEFDEVIAYIDEHYQYRATAFSNGVGETCIENAAGENTGSCKIFAFARLHGLSDSETLHCFGRYYRDEVLSDPSGTGHMNIRTFMQHGGQAILFEEPALIPLE